MASRLTTTLPPHLAKSKMNGGAPTHGALPIRAKMEDETVTSDAQVEQLRRAFIDELCAIRCDVDILKKGGWNVKVGPFMSPIALTDAERQESRNVIMSRVQSKVSAVVLEETTPVSVPAHGSAPGGEVGIWKPAYIRSLSPLQDAKSPTPTSMVTFTWDFISAIFKGAIEHSPGLYYMPKAAGGSLLANRTFYAIDSTHEPFLPASPCGHGAKLTAFFNNAAPEDGGATADEDIPLFISASGWGGKSKKSNEYIYFGTYSQTRWSDRLGYDELSLHVPAHVKEYHATQLADPARPEWVTKAMMKQFWPMPEYDGVIPQTTPNGSVASELDEKKKKRASRDIKEYLQDLMEWEQEAAQGAKFLKKENLLAAFEKADCDENPGLRLWLEYLECKKFDHEFYDMLVREQVKFNMCR